MAPPGKKEVDNRPFVLSIRSVAYGISFFLIFCLTCAELGLVSQQLHEHGRWAQNYASLQYRNVLGLLLCAVILSLLICIFHYWLPIGVVVFSSLVLALFFGVGGGVIRGTTPFRGTDCHRPVEDYPPRWQPYVHSCGRVVAIEAVSWSVFALYTMMLLGSLCYIGIIRFATRPTPGGYYASADRVV